MKQSTLPFQSNVKKQEVVATADRPATTGSVVPQWTWNMEMSFEERSEHAHTLLKKYFPTNIHLQKRR